MHGHLSRKGCVVTYIIRQTKASTIGLEKSRDVRNRKELVAGVFFLRSRNLRYWFKAQPQAPAGRMLKSCANCFGMITFWRM